MSKHSKKNNRKKQPRNFKKKFRKKVVKLLIEQLEWPEGLAKFVGLMVIGFLSVTGVWHKKIAQTMDSNNKIESDVRKIQRFFCKAVINYHFFSLMLYRMIGIRGKVTILLDRTNWDYGKSHINIFVAAILCQYPGLTQSFAIPIVWEVFAKKGNSNIQERKHLMRQLLTIIDKNNIEVVLGDREFVGPWIQFLHETDIPFIIRIKKNMYVEYDGKRVQTGVLCASASYKNQLKFNVVLNGMPVQLAATKSSEGELVIVIASMSLTDDLLSKYRLRWLIELFFKSIKSKGFNFEETHMIDPEKIKMLFALTTLATLLAMQMGVLRHHHIKKISIKNHGRPTFSLFTYGLDFFRALFRGAIQVPMKKICQFLLGPPEKNPSTLTQGENPIYALEIG